MSNTDTGWFGAPWRKIRGFSPPISRSSGAGKSYTVDTLRYFRNRLGPAADIYFILGLDAFREITTWREYRELFGLAHFIVTDRPFEHNKDPQMILPPELATLFQRPEKGYCEHVSGMRLYFHDITALDISATIIRNLVKQNKSIRYLVPDTIRRYIEQKGLYR